MGSGKRVYIIGFMGSGKTTAGKKIAAFLGWQFHDLDHEIELIAHKPVKDIFSESGEDYFRELESGILKGLITESDTVISAGGGTPCYAGNMEFMLKTGIVVYLKMTPGQLKSRLKDRRDGRPLIKEISGNDLIDYITQKLAERERFYLMANIVEDGINLDVKTLCENIKYLLQ
jgi:shikimate kinase